MDDVVRQVILDEQSDGGSDFLSPEDCELLLQEDETDEESVKCGEDILKGYPHYPLYKRIAAVLTECLETGSCSVLQLQSYHLLDESEYTEKRSQMMAALTTKLQGMKSLWEDWTESEQTYHMRQILKELGKRGMMDLLGMRKTGGSKDVFPPSKSTLLRSFNKQNKESSKLTVGARALTKHCHRDETSSWWGTAKGGEEAKNKHATEIAHKILDDAAWINIHGLPKDINVIEVRQTSGYGARWTSDGLNFRGFLEPQMEDGHEAGWRH